MKYSGMAICFNFEKEKLAAVEAVALKCGIRVKTVEPEAYGKPVGEYFGFVGLELPPGDGEPFAFTEELMVISVFTGADLNRFLRALRESGIDVPYKAMLTETNKTWPPAALAMQIKAEHEQMHQ